MIGVILFLLLLPLVLLFMIVVLVFAVMHPLELLADLLVVWFLVYTYKSIKRKSFSGKKYPPYRFM